ncbi:hypothetical protein PHJA_002682300 [Phtheirospermum japonicum]|uniref:Late embryogenesis abundant protein LEA-2 subgroup domain-containing protein n=1 Tax=Phtheirospermum japonicum TaxID=374723 RepID=A0A830DH22_9LAMI|nr:hypothetical protein PHJA_002682300 [Phtheirospermum japonicum]
MGSSHSPKGRTNLASCIVATIFLVFILIYAFAVYFTVFKPKGPKISVNAVQVPSFSSANSTVSFNFSQYVTVKNPNHAAFCPGKAALGFTSPAHPSPVVCPRTGRFKDWPAQTEIWEDPPFLERSTAVATAYQTPPDSDPVRRRRRFQRGRSGAPPPLRNVATTAIVASLPPAAAS